MKYKISYVNKKRLKNLGKKTVIVILVPITVFLSAKGIIHAVDENKVETINDNYSSYSDMLDSLSSEAQDEFQKELNNDYSLVKELLDYIEVSERLKDLKLDQYNLDDANVDELFSIEKIDLLVNKFEELKQTNKVISKEAYELNATVALLKRQEKLVNERVYFGYNDLESFSLNFTKLIAFKKAGFDPLKTQIRGLHSSLSTGESGCIAVEYKDGKERFYSISSNENSELMSVAGTAFVCQTQKSKPITETEKTSYNKDRNKFMISHIKEINDLFEEMQKQNRKAR